jgi:2-polyprenyl-6-methoxyphenol hydroxylase-like FAD-dependent oxidoreductase
MSMSSLREPPLDALVVGAGPVGLILASELRRHGASCRIVDRAAAPTDKSKAVILHARTIEHLDQFALAQEFIERGTVLHGVSFFQGGRRLAQLRFDRIDSHYPFVLDIPQSTTERLLGDHLKALGGEVEREVELVDIEREEDGVTAVLRHADGRRERQQARYLCGCDGSHSPVREFTGTGFAGSSYEEEWILADVRIEASPFARDEATIFAEPHHFLAVFPLPDDRWRLIAVRKVAEPGQPADPATVEEFEELLLHHAGEPVRLFDPAWITPFRTGRKHAAHLRDGNIFLSGDAAHIRSQVSGQGLNSGVQDAINLGWKLALVCRGKARPELLDTYEIERLPVIKKILSGTDVATRAVTVRHAAGQQLVYGIARLLVGFEPVQDYLTRNISEMEINYRDGGCVSSFFVENADRRDSLPLPGDHAPPAPHLETVPEGRPVRLYELIRRSGHTVVLLQGERTPPPAAGEVADLARALDARFGDEVRPLAVRVRDDWRPGDVVAPLVHDDNGEMHRAYDAEAASVYLIRPDGYLAFRADWTDRHVLLEFLETYLIRRYGDKARQLLAEASSTYRKLGMNG